MSNHVIAEFPQEKYYFRIYDNAKRLHWKTIQKETGCYGLINLTYFALSSNPLKGIQYFDHQSAVMISGKWELPPKWHEYGICVDKNGQLTLGTEKDAVYDYAVALPPAVINSNIYNKTAFTKNGATYLGIKADGTVVLLMAGKDKGASSSACVKILQGRDCIHILRWDGSWSTQGTLGPGLSVEPSQYRCVRTYLLVFQRPDPVQKPDIKDKEEFLTDNPTFIAYPISKNPTLINPVKVRKTKAMLHSTGTPGANAKAIANSMNSANAKSSVEFCIDDTGIYQLMPMGVKSWHCGTAYSGGPSANNTHWACELCEPQENFFLPINWRVQAKGGAYKNSYVIKRLQQELQALGLYQMDVDGSFGPGTEAAVKAYQASVGLAQDGSVGPGTLKALQRRDGSLLRYRPALAQTYFDKVYQYAVQLFAWGMKQCGASPDTDIICHCEGHQKGIASNHADVLHWFPAHDKTMEIFRADVKTEMEGNPAIDPLSEAVDKLYKGGYLNSPDYWKAGNYSAANVQSLLIKFAANI